MRHATALVTGVGSGCSADRTSRFGPDGPPHRATRTGACRSRRLVSRLAASAILIASVTAAADTTSEMRPFRVDDLFELEDVGRYFGGPYAFSADGLQLAMTRVRPKKQLANHKWEYLWGNAGGDVWVQSSPDVELANLTDGASDGSGWWSPQFSPDTTKIAMLSTRGGSVRLWLWDSATGELRPLTERAVDLGADVHERPFVWVDDGHLLCPVLPEGEQPLGMRIELQTPAIATAEWPKAAKGTEPTASVLDSGVSPCLDCRPQGELLLIDVATGEAKTILEGNIRWLQVSPDRAAVAFTRQVSIYTPKPDESLGFDTSMYAGTARVALVRTDGGPIAIEGGLPGEALEDSLRWSADGGELAYLAREGGREHPPVLYRVDLALRRVTALPLGGIDAAPIIRESSQLEWTAAGDLMVRGAERTPGQAIDVATSRDWWLVSGTDAPRLLTAELESPPTQLWPQDGRRAFVGLAGGDIWRLDPAVGTLENLTSELEPEVDHISWPAMTNQGDDEYRQPGRTYGQVLFAAGRDAEIAPYALDLHTGAIITLPKAAPGARLVAYEPVTRTAVMYAADRAGMTVWRTTPGAQEAAVLVAANRFLSQVAEAAFRALEYTSLNGEKLAGWMLLPPGYEPGRRYPVITWVYAGAVYGKRPPEFMGINSSSALNLQVAAAHGYVVLLPSMPLAREGLAEEPMLRLTEGVLPAVDRLVELGIADPDRLFVMGQSFGGFSTYGLVTQTRRFRAGVALAGLSNLISMYGQLDARERYTPYPHEHFFQQAIMESAQVGMGNPPWRDLGRYLRNSPIFHVERVQTPLLIIQGDLDYVPIQQGEEFFTSLYRQGKRARFVRYWGEGHVLESPANIRDMWVQIFRWFDEISSGAPVEGQGSSTKP